MKELGSADYLIQVLDGVIDPMWFPSLVFVLAANCFCYWNIIWNHGYTDATCFTTGRPIWCQYRNHFGGHCGSPQWCYLGDHCSPISDTTVLSSAGTGCDHAEHVRTQLPYAMVSGLISLLCCSIPVGLGVSWGICLLGGYDSLYR